MIMIHDPKFDMQKSLNLKKKHLTRISKKTQIKTKLIIIVKQKIAITTPATNISLKHKK